MFWAVVIGFVLLIALGVGLNMWTGYQSPTKGVNRSSMSTLTRSSEARWGRNVTLGSLVGLIAVLCWYKLHYQSDDQIAARAKHKAAALCADRRMAFVMSQRFVEQRLRAPASAKFPYITDGVDSVALGNCKFAVSAYVDSQNGFGAMVRTSYEAEMEYDPSKKVWRALRVQLGP